MKDFEGFIKNYATRDFIYFFAEKSIEIYKNQVKKLDEDLVCTITLPLNIMQHGFIHKQVKVMLSAWDMERAGKLYALVDTGDVHCLMIGAAGVGKTAHFLYPNIEYACACGMSFLTTDTKGDLYRNYAGIAKKYYGYHTAVIDLRNPTRSDGDNMLHLVNKYMDKYLADHTNLSAKAKAEKYAKITAKTIISSGGTDSSSYGQNAFFYDAAEGVLTAAILLIAEFCPDGKRHIISVFKLIQDLLAPSKVKGKNQFQLLLAKLPD